MHWLSLFLKKVVSESFQPPLTFRVVYVNNTQCLDCYNFEF